MTTPLAFADAPEWGDLVGRLFSGDAPADVVPPGIILAADRPEWAVLRRETPWHHSLLATGTAGSVGQIVIQQPSPDRISVVEQILISNDGAAAAGYRLGLFSANTVLGVPTRAATRDLRRLTVTTIAQATTSAAPSLTSVKKIMIPAGTSLLVQIPRGWMLSNVLDANHPNATFLILEMDAVGALDVIGQFWGYERRLRPEERILD